MTRKQRRVWALAWVATWLLVAAMLLALKGCGGKPAAVVEVGASVARCEARAVELVFASRTCSEAQIKIDALIVKDPDCRATYPDGGPDVCAVLRARRDGGRNEQ